METIAGFPFFPVQMTRDGQIIDGDEVTALMQHVGGQPAPVDLLVLAHGWNNDMAEAKALYVELLGNIGSVPGRRLVVMGVFWPSKKFAESDLIPAGGIASAGDEAEREALKARLAGLADSFDGGGAHELAALADLVDRLGESAARAAYIEGLRRLLPADPVAEDDGDDDFRTLDPEEIFGALDLDASFPGPQDGGGVGGMPGDFGGPAGMPGGLGSVDATGAAGGMAGTASGRVAAADRALNLTTYFQMKARAGTVGAGLNFVLAQVARKIPGTRIHLVGHSFGARLVTAAVDGPTPFGPASLTLLQGAFSHHGLTSNFDGQRDGAFHNVVDKAKVRGPIAITHTRNDSAVGRLYAFASRFSGDDAAGFGDASDRYGGIGRNGAVKLRPDRVVSITLPAAGAAIRLTPGKVNNLLADAQIRNHGDVRNPAVAALVRTALG